MFFSYSLAGLIPLFPYMVFSTKVAMPVSIVLSILALAVLGIIHARLSKIHILKTALKMSAIGGVAILVGVVVGRLVKAF